MGIFRPSNRVLLALSGDVAVWSHWRGGLQIDEFIEALPAGHGVSSPSRCPWVLDTESAGLPLDVHLVVDSAHSEVLRVETATSPTGLGKSGIGALIQERRLLERLRQNHTDAVVSRVRGTSALESAWLSREQWPEHWNTWLQGLLSKGVVFTRVSSSLQLLARHTSNAGGDVLFVLIGDQRQQHTLVRGGVVVFRRVVAVGGEDSIRTALTDSLKHLQSRLSVESVSLRCLGMSDALGEEWKSHGIVDEDVRSISDAAEQLPAQACIEVGERDIQIARLLARTVVETPKLRGPMPACGPVAEMLEKRVARDRNSRLSFATIFSVLIASITVVFAVVEGFGSVRDSVYRQKELARLSLRISDYDEASRSIHPQAENAALLLLRIETLEQGRQQSAPALMNLLADVLEDFPAIGLDTLQWRTDFEDLDQSEPLLVATAEPWASQLETNAATSSSLVLEFSGKVDASRSLRERQEQFDAFVQSLVELEAVERVEVLLSPLAQAAAGSRKVVSSKEPDYQVRVNLHDS